MSRQNASRKMFGLIMLTITLLLAACGTDEGDTAPTATSGADAAVPTLPMDEATASVAETEEISQEDLTVVTPDLPATAVEDEIVATAAVVTPAGLTSTPGTLAAEATAAAESSSANGTAAVVAGTASTPSADTKATADAGPTESAETAVSSTPSITAEVATEAVDSTPDSETADASEGVTFDIPGDGTGGSGQPGERSSNVPGEATPSASPVAGLSVEGCEVPDVPAFTGATTAYVTVAEVNFRSGPGIDCPQILEDPLGQGVAVTILGGPVTQSADGSEWMQIEVDGVPGWVTTEFLEPAE